MYIKYCAMCGAPESSGVIIKDYIIMDGKVQMICTKCNAELERKNKMNQLNREIK